MTINEQEWLDNLNRHHAESLKAENAFFAELVKRYPVVHQNPPQTTHKPI